MASSSEPRVLYLHRECSLVGMDQAFIARSKRVIGCHSKSRGKGYKYEMYSRPLHYEVANELRAGKYDVVATLSDPELRCFRMIDELEGDILKKTADLVGCLMHRSLWVTP